MADPILKLGRALLPALFFWSIASADSLTMINGKELKGVVVEKHFDRVILSTEKGEVPVLLAEIKEILYDDPEQNFLQAGRSFEDSGKFEEALAYYEKAIELNPDFEEAKAAAVGIRSRLWARLTEGPRVEMEKQQVLYDSWNKGGLIDAEAKSEAVFKKKKDSVREGLGLFLEKKDDWTYVEFVNAGTPAALTGLKKNDRLIDVDGRSLRYLALDAVMQSLLEPRFSNFILDFERTCFLEKTDRRENLRRSGLKLSLEYRGIEVLEVLPKSAAQSAGLKAGDLLVRIDGESTRYLPITKAQQLIEQSADTQVILTVRRSALLTRK